IRSAPTLKSWMTPFASVAILEKLALLKIARCKGRVFNRASVCNTSLLASVASAVFVWAIRMCHVFRFCPEPDGSHPCLEQKINWISVTDFKQAIGRSLDRFGKGC